MTRNDGVEENEKRLNDDNSHGKGPNNSRTKLNEEEDEFALNPSSSSSLKRKSPSPVSSIEGDNVNLSQGSGTSITRAKSEMPTHVYTSAKYSHDGITFIIGKDRPDNRVESGEDGKKATGQGDHVTSYRTFLEFLHNLTIDKDLQEIPDNLIKVIGSILPEDDQITKFSSAKDKYLNDNKYYLSREDRKIETKEARMALLAERNIDNDKIKTRGTDAEMLEIDECFAGEPKTILEDSLLLEQLISKERIQFDVGGLSEYYEIDNTEELEALKTTIENLHTIHTDHKIKQRKNSLKLSENTRIGQLIVDLGNTFVVEMQNAKNMAFAKQGESDKGEGPRVKGGIFTLKLINELKKINGLSGELKDQQIKSFKLKLEEPYSELRQGLKKVVKILFAENLDMEFLTLEASKNYSTITNNVNKDPKFKDEPDDVKAAEIEKRKLNSQQVKRNDLADKKVNELITSGDLFNLLTSKEGEIPNVVGKAFGDLFDFECKGGRKENLMYEVTARHLVIMFNAFDALQEFGELQKTQMINTFIEKEVLENQKWNEYKIDIEDEMEEENSLNLEDIITGIGGEANLNNRNYKMLSQSEKEEKIKPERSNSI